MPWQYHEGRYESEIERYAAWDWNTHLDDKVTLAEQVEVRVPCSRRPFRIDIVAKTRKGYKVALECDGKKYHTDPLRDEVRDLLILNTGAVKAIYRFRGGDIYYHLNDCLFVMSRVDRCLFSERGRRNLELLASDEVKARLVDPTDSTTMVEPCGDFRIGYTHPPGVIPVRHATLIQRRSLTGRWPDEWTAFLKMVADRPYLQFGELYRVYAGLCNRPVYTMAVKTRTRKTGVRRKGSGGKGKSRSPRK